MADTGKKSLLLVFRRPAYGRGLARGGYDLALAAAAFEQPVSLLFMDDGVWQLLPGQETSRIDARSIESTLASLPLYDIDSLYADEKSLQARGLSLGELAGAITAVGEQQLRELMVAHDQVLVF